MSTSRAREFPMRASPADGHGGGSRGWRDAASDEGETACPPPLPADPQVRARIITDIERGIAQAQAGLGDDLEDVLADMDKKIAATR